MAKDNKFGTFGGVFTPSILTILGVIMYLRLPWVVGNSGLYAAIGIVVVAHVISFCTGASVASIATDKAVGAGGPYYIISRSLGLPIGGTIGLALFVGLAFSISLYIIGFSESFLSYWGWEVTKTNIRVCGTIVIVLLTVLTLISTALAIKTQYLILALIALSLVSIGVGSPDFVVASEPQTRPLEGGASMAVLFGIFFPAVTGFTAGVNMSGDLQDPKKSLPVGTMAAIGVGLVVYLILAAFLAYRVPTEALVNDPEVLLHIAWVPGLVVAGIWGATVSSALGSILGAPRILQALSVDRITPRFFGKGAGPSNEPRRALFLAFALGEAGILIAELDAIARIVSMVFLTMYGVVNLSAAIEAWVSPDFRPDFKIPKTVSVIGAILCALIMIQLDLVAMLGATVAMVGIFAWLQRRQLRLDSGDAWEGVWSSVVRTGLHRLSQEAGQQRNWRPNILYFSPEGSHLREPTLRFASALISGRGIITDFELQSSTSTSTRPAEPALDEELPVGIFRRPMKADDMFRTITGAARYHGFSGLSPNTVMLDWATYAEERERFADLLTRMAALDLNLLLYARDPKRALGDKKNIDVWWRASGGNLALSLSLLRFITISSDWQDTRIRFLIVTEDSSNADVLQASARRFVSSNRMDAQVRVINNSLGVKEFEDWIREESQDADLTLVGLPNRPDEIDEDFLGRADRLQKDIGTVMFLRGSSFFKEVLRMGRGGTASQSMPIVGDVFELELPPLDLPSTGALASAASNFAGRHQKLVAAFHEQCVERIYALNNELLRNIRTSVEKHFSMLEKGMVGTDPRRKRKTVNRVQSAFLQEARRRLTEMEEELLPEMLAILERRIETFLDDKSAIDEASDLITVERRAEDFKADSDDEGPLRRFKRRRRIVAFLTRSKPSYDVPLADLQSYYVDLGVRDLLRATVRQLVAETHQLAIHVGKTLNGSRTSLALLGDTISAEDLPGFLADKREESFDELDGIIEMNEQRVEQHKRALLSGTRSLAQAFSNDLERVDILRFVGKERRADREKEALHEELRGVPQAWMDNQELLLERAKAGLAVSDLQHRLASLAHRIRTNTALEVRNGPLSECQKLHDDLKQLSEKLEEGKPETLKLNYSFGEVFDPRTVIDNLITETRRWSEELPESVKTATDESISLLEEGQSEEADPIELPVRQIVEFVVESEFVGALQEELIKIPPLEQRAMGVAQDVTRLMSFSLSEYDSLTESGEAVDFAAHVGPVLQNGLERLEPEVERLTAIGPSVANVIDRNLKGVIERTNPYELADASGDVSHLRLAQGKRAVSGVRAVLERGLERVRGGLVKLLYRRSAGLLLARRLRAEAGEGRSVVDRVLSLVNQSAPRPEVLSSLPFYYRQLFFGQSAVNDAFWVGRETELTQSRQAVANYRRGSHGALVVIGERNAGKTALCRRIVARQLTNQTVHRIPAPAGGSIDPAAFKRAFESAVGTRGNWDAIFRALPENCAIVLSDVELWWERSENGLVVIDELLRLIDEYGRRCLFILDLSAHAFSFINRFRPLADKALAVIECGPVAAESLKEIVTLRHASTGLKFELNGKAEDQLAPWTQARLFTSHFDYAHGNLGAALRSWISYVDKVSDDVLQISVPQGRGWDVLDELKVEWVALLLQFLLHKQLTFERLTRVTGLEPAGLRRDLDSLIRMGLVSENRQGVLETNRFVEHLVLDRFEKRGLLP
jgi:amino acid transporter